MESTVTYSLSNFYAPLAITGIIFLVLVIKNLDKLSLAGAAMIGLISAMQVGVAGNRLSYTAASAALAFFIWYIIFYIAHLIYNKQRDKKRRERYEMMQELESNSQGSGTNEQK